MNMLQSFAALPQRLVGRRCVAALALRAVTATTPSLVEGVAHVRRFQTSSTGDDAKPTKDATLKHSSFLETIDVSNPGAEDRRKLSKLIQEVVHTKANSGDFVPRVVIGNLCTKYQTFDLDKKKQFLLILARDLHVDPTLVEQSLNYFVENFAHVQQDAETHSGSEIDWESDRIERFLRTFRNLRTSLAPLYETFFQQILSQREGGMLFLVQMRADLLQVLRKNAAQGPETAALRSLDASLKSFLASWFSVGFLQLERVTYEDSPGQLLEKIIRYEAVHPVGTIQELKRRLGRGRRCFAFFHPSVPDEPLVFVHVALVKELAGSMPYIKDETERMDDETNARAAIFYSISSTQKGLQGVDLGNFLIKEVAKSLTLEHPQLEIFSTLSPVPNFVPWLESQRTNTELLTRDNADVMALERALEKNGLPTEATTGTGVVVNALKVNDWHQNDAVAAALKPLLLTLGAHYIYHEKKRKNALCQVANFHIRNGAIFERINWLGDPSPKGLRQSAGLMVNYKYDLSRVESNNETYLLHHTIALGDQPKRLLQQ